jgi:hypothetical protein
LVAEGNSWTSIVLAENFPFWKQDLVVGVASARLVAVQVDDMLWIGRDDGEAHWSVARRTVRHSHQLHVSGGDDLVSELSHIQKSYSGDRNQLSQPERRMTFDPGSSRNVLVGLMFWADEPGWAAGLCLRELRSNGL